MSRVCPSPRSAARRGSFARARAFLAGLAFAAAVSAASAPDPAPASSASPSPSPPSSPFIVGSKRFTESYILGEIVRLAASPAGAAEHRQGLGNTAVVLEALRAGSIDAYPEYIGTIDAEILGHRTPSPRDRIERELAAMGLGLGVPLGFSDGYALAMPRALAERLHVRTVSDLASHPDLVLGLSHEFLGRQDGWPGLAQAYALPQHPLGIDHGLAYDAMTSGRIAVTDVYTTDAQIAQRRLQVLEDDRHFFPSYDAVLLYRLDAAASHPAAWAAIRRLQGRIPVDAMIAMNARAELRHEPFDRIAREFMAGEITGETNASVSVSATDGLLSRVFADDLGRLVTQHLLLVGIAVAAACVLGIPLGAAAAAWPRVEAPVMAVVGLLQTVPSLALLAMLIPLLGRIGTAPALVALTLYALLPIARNTATGLAEVPRGLRESATALGLTASQRWRAVDLPLAAPTLIAGVKTAAVITVGTATIAAFVGAGGLGERIVTGLALNDHAMLLAGALPAAALALLAQGLFGVAEWWLSPLARARRRQRTR
jgi:osmoprotectant transport system permease protein